MIYDRRSNSLLEDGSSRRLKMLALFFLALLGTIRPSGASIKGMHKTRTRSKSIFQSQSTSSAPSSRSKLDFQKCFEKKRWRRKTKTFPAHLSALKGNSYAFKTKFRNVKGQRLSTLCYVMQTQFDETFLDGSKTWSLMNKKSLDRNLHSSFNICSSQFTTFLFQITFGVWFGDWAKLESNFDSQKRHSTPEVVLLASPTLFTSGPKSKFALRGFSFKEQARKKSRSKLPDKIEIRLSN